MNAPYYSDESVTLYHGDCREVLASMAPESVAAVITDPPYTERTHSKVRTKRTASSTNAVIEQGIRSFGSITDADLQETLSSLAVVTRGWVVATLDYRHAVQFDSAPPAGLKVQRLGVWVKTNPTPQLSGDRPAQGWESIAYMHRNDRRSVWNGGGSHGNFVSPIPPPEGHPTAKPLPMVRQWVQWFTKPGDVILDPFAGSGTTLRAAADEGRKAIGVELDERYCEVIARRLSQGVLDFGSAS